MNESDAIYGRNEIDSPELRRAQDLKNARAAHDMRHPSTPIVFPDEHGGDGLHDQSGAKNAPVR